MLSEAKTRQAAGRRSTGELMSLIQNTDRLDRVISEHAEEFAAHAFPELLAQLAAQRDLTPAALGEKALISRSFIYQLFSGERAPGRDIVLRLAIVLELGIEETQALLRAAQRGALYPRVPRDAAVLNALSRHLDLSGTEDMLAALGEAPLL